MRAEADGHETKPPARYTEATLVKELEERGIGRPSTYASIIGTILNRGYVYKKGTALVPAWLAFSVIRLLEEHFARLVDYEFTAAMEDDLDEIAGGDEDRVAVARASSTSAPRRRRPRACAAWSTTSARSTPARSRTFPIGDGIVLRVGRYGPYVEETCRRRRPATGEVADGATGDAAPPTSPTTCRPTS